MYINWLQHSGQVRVCILLYGNLFNVFPENLIVFCSTLLFMLLLLFWLLPKRNHCDTIISFNSTLKWEFIATVAKKPHALFKN